MNILRTLRGATAISATGNQDGDDYVNGGGGGIAPPSYSENMSEKILARRIL